MYIEAVPTEVIRMFVTGFGPADLSALAKTCRQLGKVVTPLLYEEVDWTFFNPATPSQKPPLHLLVRTLLHCSELGVYMKRVTLRDGKSPRCLWADKEKPELELADLESLARRGAEVTNPRPEQWLKELQSGNHEAFVCLLLYFCRFIEKLVLNNNFDEKYTWTLTSDAPNHETLWQAILSLDKLKEIDCDTTGQMRTPYKSDRVASLLRLPEINTIKISTYEDEINAGTSLEKIIASNVKTSVLYNSLLKEETFGTIVATVPNITSLRLGIKCPTDSWGWFGFEAWPHWLDCSKLFAALFHTGITQNLNDSTMLQPLQFLEELAISADFLTPGEWRNYVSRPLKGIWG